MDNIHRRSVFIRRTKSTIGVGVISLGLQFSVSAPAADAQGESQLEEVIVTARRVEERLQDVPISISVFDERQLTDRNINFGTDLATYTPSLQAVSEFGSSDTGFSLRGFGQDIATTPSVAVYFADAVAPRGGATERTGNGAAPGSFFDLQNVQVLKGPQGTLFGRNTTGGAVLLVPKKPTADFESYVEAAYGNYDMEQIQAVVNLPISDKVRLRVGVDQQTRDGYENNISGIGPGHFGNVDYISARASLVVDVTPDLENYTIATFNRSQDAGAMQQLFACTASQPVFGALSCAQLARDQGRGQYSVDNDLTDPEDYLRQWQTINTTTWQASDNLTVKNIASYAQFQNDIKSSIFGIHWILPSVLSLSTPRGALNIPTGALAGTTIPFVDARTQPGGDTADQQTYSEELQFQGRGFDNRLTWQAGGYLEGSGTLDNAGVYSATFLNCPNAAAFQCFNVLSSFLGSSLAGTLQQQLQSITYHNYGVYEQATYQLSDLFKVTEGLRYTDDLVSGHANKYLYSFSAPNRPVPGCFTGLTLASDCLQFFHTTSDAPTWLIDLDYTPVRDALLYAKYARGYRQGSINETGAFDHTTFAPEHVDSYEIGAKTSYQGAVSGTFDIDGFYNDFTNQQIQASFTAPAGTGIAPASSIINGGKSRIWGIELETTTKPSKAWLLDVGYTYLNTKLLSLAPVTLNPNDVYNAVLYSAQAGTALPFSPRNKVLTALNYTLPLDPSFGPLTASATYVWTASQLVNSSGLYTTIPSYGLLNLNLNWESVAGKPVDLEFFMTNVTNRFYETFLTDFSSTVAGASRGLGEPRMFGGRVRVHFR